MNKLIFCLILLCSYSLYAQEETVELDGEAVEVNPTEEPKLAEDAPAVTPAKEEPVEMAEEIVAPVAPPEKEEKPVAVTETDVDEKKKFKATESHWYTIFGFEAMEYELPFAYDGEKKDFSPEQRQLYGGRLGFGGEIYLGIGFLTSTRIEGYYMGTLFESAKTADPGVSGEDVATVKDTGQIYGADIVQTLSFIWELKTKNPVMNEMTYLTVEPFVEAGIGKAWALNKKAYNYDTDVIEEEYTQTFTDELTNSKLGLGFNLTSREGFFLYVKATQNRYDITNRRTKGDFKRNGNASAAVASDPSTSLEPIMIYAVGGGYKF